MGRYALRYLGHRPGAPLSYFTGAAGGQSKASCALE